MHWQTKPYGRKRDVTDFLFALETRHLRIASSKLRSSNFSHFGRFHLSIQTQFNLVMQKALGGGQQRTNKVLQT